MCHLAPCRIRRRLQAADFRNPKQTVPRRFGSCDELPFSCAAFPRRSAAPTPTSERTSRKQLRINQPFVMGCLVRIRAAKAAQQGHIPCTLNPKGKKKQKQTLSDFALIRFFADFQPPVRQRRHLLLPLDNFRGCLI